jgi:hypothetical protein
MRLFFLILAFSTAALAGTPTDPGTRIELGHNDAEWQPLFHQLALAEPTFATFTEKRMFPFRKRPTELQGEMRLDPARGLSLHYLQPDEHILIADRSGLLQRDAEGHSRAMPQDSHIAAVNAALLPVLSFNLPEIGRMFEIFGTREGTEWRLEFVPHDATVAKVLGHLVVIGDGRDVRRLEFVRSANQYVEISLGPVRRDGAFAPDVLRRYFR